MKSRGSRMKERTQLIQVGIKALLKPNGDFEAAMPIYISATPELMERENSIVASLELVEAQYLKDYIEKCKKVAAHANEKGKRVGERTLKKKESVYDYEMQKLRSNN